MSEWKKYKIADIATMKNGKVRPKTKGDIPVYGGNGIMDWTDSYNAENVIIIGRVGAYCGVAYLCTGRCWVSDNAISISARPDVDLLYLYYLIHTINFHYYHIGGAQPLMTQSIIGDIQIIIPPLEEQKRIAGILSALDDKIELNRRINENLEQQAQALFKHWFVEHSTNGTLNDIVENSLSGDWGKETSTGIYNTEVYCIRGADIPDIRIGNKGKMSIRYILEKNCNKKKLSANDIVVEISGGSPTQSTGRVCLITQSLLNRLGKSTICTNFCKAITPKKNYAIYLYLYWQYLYDNNIMFGYENGTTGIKNLDITNLINKERIFIPPYDDIVKLNRILIPVFDAINENGIENEKLAFIRDTLLPKLMSGELNIEEYA